MRSYTKKLNTVKNEQNRQKMSVNHKSGFIENILLSDWLVTKSIRPKKPLKLKTSLLKPAFLSQIASTNIKEMKLFQDN